MSMFIPKRWSPSLVNANLLPTTVHPAGGMDDHRLASPVGNAK